MLLAVWEALDCVNIIRVYGEYRTLWRVSSCIETIGVDGAIRLSGYR